jgi:hypothetical protein
MRNFLKILPYKQALMVYVVVLLLLTIAGKQLNRDWYGFKFSIPIVLTILIVDLLATYRQYKKWQKN